MALREKTNLYVLKSGRHTVPDSKAGIKTYHKGDKVPLTANQFQNFQDKFIPVAQVEAEAKLAQEVAEATALAQEEIREAEIEARQKIQSDAQAELDAQAKADAKTDEAKAAAEKAKANAK